MDAGDVSFNSEAGLDSPSSAGVGMKNASMPNGGEGDDVGRESSPGGGGCGNSSFANGGDGEGGGIENASVPNGGEGDNTGIKKESG